MFWALFGLFEHFCWFGWKLPKTQAIFWIFCEGKNKNPFNTMHKPPFHPTSPNFMRFGRKIRPGLHLVRSAPHQGVPLKRWTPALMYFWVKPQHIFLYLWEINVVENNAGSHQIVFIHFCHNNSIQPILAGFCLRAILLKNHITSIHVSFLILPFVCWD